MNRIVLPLAVLATVFLVGCDEGPTDIDTESAPLLKPGGKPGKPGGGGGGGPADPEIAFWGNRGLYVMNADGSNAALVISDDPFGLSSPSWSPLGDGSVDSPYRIVTQYDLCGPLVTVEITTPAEGGVVASPPTIIDATTDFDCASRPAWSPDGSRIALTATDRGLCPSGESEIWTTDGSDLVRLTHSCASNDDSSDPSWSPDGNAIAYRAEDGGTEVIKILHLSDGHSECVFDTAWLDDVAWLIHGPDWGRVDADPILAFTAIRSAQVGKGGKPANVFSVYTLALQKDASGHYSAAGLPMWAFDGRRQSWSPDDTRLLTDGVTVYELHTGETTRLARGEKPDWRR